MKFVLITVYFTSCLVAAVADDSSLRGATIHLNQYPALASAISIGDKKDDCDYACYDGWDVCMGNYRACSGTCGGNWDKCMDTCGGGDDYDVCAENCENNEVECKEKCRGIRAECDDNESKCLDECTAAAARNENDDIPHREDDDSHSPQGNDNKGRNDNDDIPHYSADGLSFI